MQKNIRAAVGLFLLLATAFYVALTPSVRTVWAYEEAEKHPIDTALEKKMDDDPSTIGMIEAHQWAVQEWDKLLNENYNALMKEVG